MKVYVAARFTEKRKVLNIYNLLRNAGHTITMDWTTHKNIKPYDKNPVIAQEYAIEDMNGVKECEIFILLTSMEAGSGSSSELGAAILSNQLTGKPRIYVVGKFTNNNFFNFHPSISRYKNIQQVLKVF